VVTDPDREIEPQSTEKDDPEEIEDKSEEPKKIDNLDKEESDRQLTLRTKFAAQRGQEQIDAIVRSYARLEEHYRKKVSRHVYGLRTEVISKFEAHRGTNDIRVLEMLFDKDTANRELRKVSHPYIAKALEVGALGVVAELRGGESKSIGSPTAQALIAMRTILVTRINTTIEDALIAALEDGLERDESVDLIAARIRKVFNHAASRSSLENISITQIAGAVNSGRVFEMREQGVRKIGWINRGGDKVRVSHQINGEVVTIGGKFSCNVQYPGDPQGPAREVCKCQCSVYAVMDS
jgi:hypothetical protein